MYVYVYIYIYIYIYTYTQVSWPTSVKGYPKALFSVPIILRSGGRRYSFLGLLHLPLIHTI